MPLVLFAIVVAAALGGGATVTAADALPGDILWGFKTGVTEHIQGALAADDRAKARWDIAIVAKRLDEAQKLAGESKLDANAQAALTASIELYTHDIAGRIHALQTAGRTDAAAEVAARFQAQLARHAPALAETSAGQKNDEAQQTIAPFLGMVRDTLDAAATLSAGAAAMQSGVAR